MVCSCSFLAAAASVLIVATNAAAGSEWSYEGSTGPSSWGGACATGKWQSPINIPRTNNTRKRFDPFVFSNYDRTPDEAYIYNPGATVKYAIKVKDSNKTPKVMGGGLPSEYAFAQLHFHWGESDTQGSEHTISEVSYPMEVHLVHYNTRYGDDLGSAIAGGKGAKDTLAVLGSMFQLSNKNNDQLDPIIEALEEFIDEASLPDAKIHTKLFPLQDFLPVDTESLYRYQGGLTTPGCDEIVVWTVFKAPIPISVGQMSRFRAVSAAFPVMANNYRPTQPLNGREILDVLAITAGAAANAAATAVVVAAAVAVAARNAVFV